MNEAEILMPLSDNELMRDFLAGNPDAFRELVERYQKSLINYLYKFTGSVEIAEEVTQETFTAVWQNISKFKQDAPFRAWIYAIATHRSQNAMRRKRPICRENLEEREGISSDPAQYVDEQERAEAVRAALEGLSEDQRAVFILRFYQDLSYEEIAQALGCPLGTVKSRMCYALKKMKDILQKYQD